MNLVRKFLQKLFRIVDFGAAMFLLVITVLTFTAVIMRYVLTMAFPGSFDVGRLLLGVAIFWGIAVAAYKNSHISVDLFWNMLPPRLQRVVDVFADTVFAFFSGVLAWTLFQQVTRVRVTGQTTFELSIPIWPFYAVAWIGLALCFVIVCLRVLTGILGVEFTSEEDKVHAHDA